MASGSTRPAGAAPTRHVARRNAPACRILGPPPSRASSRDRLQTAATHRHRAARRGLRSERPVGPRDHRPLIAVHWRSALSRSIWLGAGRFGGRSDRAGVICGMEQNQLLPRRCHGPPNGTRAPPHVRAKTPISRDNPCARVDTTQTLQKPLRLSSVGLPTARSTSKGAESGPVQGETALVRPSALEDKPKSSG